MSKGKRISYIGLRSGRLLVIGEKRAPEGSKSLHKIAICKCDCGKIVEVRGTNIVNQVAKSCGCIALEKNTKRLTKHGMFGTRIYTIWNGIKKRCFDSNDTGYERYGARGITMCEEWKNDFVTFYKWATDNGYKEDLTLDRINNDGNYEPNNCRWATRKEQARNRRRNKLLNYKGEIHCASYWAEKIGLNYHTLLTRLRKWKDTNKALEYRKEQLNG